MSFLCSQPIKTIKMNFSSLVLSSSKALINPRPSTPSTAHSRTLPVSLFQPYPSLPPNLLAKKPSTKSSITSSRHLHPRKNSTFLFDPTQSFQKNEMVVILRSHEQMLNLPSAQENPPDSCKPPFRRMAVERQRTIARKSQHRVVRRLQEENREREKAYRFLGKGMKTEKIMERYRF